MSFDSRKVLSIGAILVAVSALWFFLRQAEKERELPDLQDAPVVPTSPAQDGPSSARGKVQNGRAGARGTRAPEEIPCEVPSIKGVPEFNVELEPRLVRDATGGRIAPGRYRLRGAKTDDAEQVGGLWTILLDIAPNGQGAFYRRIGLRKLASRIEWGTSEARFSFRVLCPDIHASQRSFFYSVRGESLVLMTNDGIVLFFERYADSQVAHLPPPRTLPEGKTALPPARTGDR